MINLLLSLALAQDIRVMIIDTGVTTKYTEINTYLASDNKKQDLQDQHGHGTHVTGLVLYGPELDNPVCNRVKLYVCRFKHDVKVNIPTWHTDCFQRALDLNIHIVNFSAVGQMYDSEEHDLVKKMNKAGIKLAVAAGNDSVDITRYKAYPASYDLLNLFTVGNGINAKDRSSTSNYGKPDMVWRDGNYIKSFGIKQKYVMMSGTSQSTAIFTHDLIQEECRK